MISYTSPPEWTLLTRTAPIFDRRLGRPDDDHDEDQVCAQGARVPGDGAARSAGAHRGDRRPGGHPAQVPGADPRGAEAARVRPEPEGTRGRLLLGGRA